MRVCVINSIFPPYARGGAEMVAYGAARAFADGGHEVFVITCAPFEGGRSFAGKWETQFSHPEPRRHGRGEGSHMVQGVGSLHSARASVEMTNNVRIFRFTPFNLFSIFNVGKYPKLLRLFWHAIDMVNPHTYLVVRRILIKERPDLILTHNLKGLGYSVHLAIHHSRYNKQFVSQHAKWFHTIHDLGAIHPTGLRIYRQERTLMQHNPLVALYALINKKLLGDPDVVISPSQFLLDEYRNRGFFPKSRTAIIRNPIPTSSTHSSPSKPLIPNFLYAGQLEPYKGIRLLLDVWRRFAAAHKECELHIAGEGSMRAIVENAAARMARVHYHGFVPHDKLGELFSGAHFTVIPSLAYENSPTTIGESFSYGVPVIASRIGGIPELVDDGVNGFLFEPGDREALYDAMERALESKWETLSKNAKKSAADFSIEQYRATLLSLYPVVKLR